MFCEKIQSKFQLATKPLAPIVASYRVARKAGNSSEKNGCFTDNRLRCNRQNSIETIDIENWEIKTIDKAIAI